MLRIKLIKSKIANTPRNRATVKALGLNKIGSSNLLPDNPQVRGMIHHVKHLLSVEVVEGEVTKAPAKAKATAKEAPAKPAKAAPVKKPAATKAAAKKTTKTEE